MRRLLGTIVMIAALLLMAVSIRYGVEASSASTTATLAPVAVAQSQHSAATPTPNSALTQAAVASTQVAAAQTASALRVTAVSVDATSTAVALAPTATAAAYSTHVAAMIAVANAERDEATSLARALAILTTQTADARRTQIADATATVAAIATREHLTVLPMTQMAQATQHANMAYWDAIRTEAWNVTTVVLILTPIVVVVALIVVMIPAISWRIQGMAGAQAQAVVVTAAQRREPIAVNHGNAELSRYTDTEDEVMTVLDEMMQLGMHPNSGYLMPASRYRHNERRDRVVKALAAAGEAESVNGVAVRLTRRSLVELRDAIADGAVNLP